MGSVEFILAVHNHQPVGNFDHVIEDAYQNRGHQEEQGGTSPFGLVATFSNHGLDNHADGQHHTRDEDKIQSPGFTGAGRPAVEHHTEESE